MAETSLPNRAGACVFNRAGKVLIVSPKDRADKPLNEPIYWMLPKGHIELGEMTYEAAEREVREEAGVKALVDTTTGACVSDFNLIDLKDDSIVEHVVIEWWTLYAVEPIDNWQSEGRLVRWVEPDLALKILSFPDQRSVVRRALALPSVEEPLEERTTSPEEIDHGTT